MTVIRPNSVSGITSITAQANEINFFRSNGALAGLQLNGVNFNTTTGVSTFNNLDVDGHTELDNVNIAGVTTFTGHIEALSDVYIPDKIIHAGDANTQIRFPVGDVISAETNGAERLRITSAGTLLLGTSTGALANGNGIVIADATAARLSLKDTTNGVTGTDGFDVVQTGTDAYLYHRENGNMIFGTNATERLRIKSDGRVGIGTNNPDSILHLSGSAPRIKLTDTDGTDDITKIFSSGGSLYFQQRDGSSHGNIIFRTEDNSGAEERLRIASNGNIFVNNGNATANATLILSKSASGFAKLEFDEVTSQKAYIELDASEDLVHFGAAGVNQKFYAGNGERAKMTADGYSKFTSNGTYDGYSNAQQAHEFRQSLNKPTLWCSNSSSAQTWEIIRAESARGNSSAFHFFTCTSGNLTDDEFRVRGDGQVYADNNFNSGGADYAEYFEWTDGNSSYEDRRGMTVVLDGNKVKLSTSSDSTDNIIGVVSGNASVIGDAASEKWTDKYLRDDYGAYQRDENGERKLNPSFDDTKTYVSREDRQEWDAIGMVGKLRIRKGQQTGTRWIKMRDISDTVEEWLVR